MIAHVPRRALVSAAAAGVLVGVLYAASPLTLWIVAASAVLFWAAARGLAPHERRTVYALLGVAMALRVAAIAVLFLTSPHDRIVSFFWDGDGLYFKQRADVIAQLWNGVPMGPYDVWEAFHRSYGWSSYIYLLAYLEYLTGPALFATHVLNVALFTTAAVVLYRIVRPAYGRIAALTGLMLMLFLPTLVAWSISALKESLYVCLSVTGAAAAVMMVRAERWSRRVCYGGIIVLAIALNDTIRAGALVIMSGGIATGLIAAALLRRPMLIAIAAVVVAVSVGVVVSRPGIQLRITSQLRLAADLHMGNVHTEGHAYKLLDQRFYSSDRGGTKTMTLGEGLRFMVRAFAAFLVLPLPWQATSRAEIALLPQQAIWYVLIVFAGMGVVAGLRDDVVLTTMLACNAMVAGAVIALNNGNIGTMVRFRDTVVPFVVWLSGRGMVALLEYASRTPLAIGGRPVTPAA